MGALAVGIDKAVVAERGEREGQHTARHPLAQPPRHRPGMGIAAHLTISSYE